MYSDLHFVWPADNRVNLFKSNFPIGYAKNIYFTSKNGTSIGQSDPAKNYGYTATNVFEPIDSFKGDFARAYLYVITRYQDSLPYWLNRSTASNVLDGLKYPGLQSWMLQLCIKWAKLDPPGAFEMLRNDAVYSIQGNRNPYIDHPEWVEKIFGPDGNAMACVPLGIRSAKSDTYSIYPNPASDVLHVTLKNDPENAQLQLLDISGRKLFSRELTDRESTIDILQLEKGVYFLNIISEGESHISNFIRQ
jgi:hypothetical protein